MFCLVFSFQTHSFVTFRFGMFTSLLSKFPFRVKNIQTIDITAFHAVELARNTRQTSSFQCPYIFYTFINLFFSFLRKALKQAAVFLLMSRYFNNCRCSNSFHFHYFSICLVWATGIPLFMFTIPKIV